VEMGRVNSRPEIVPKANLQVCPNLVNGRKSKLGKNLSTFGHINSIVLLDLERTIYLAEYDTQFCLARISKLNGFKRKLKRVFGISLHLFYFPKFNEV